MATNGTGGTAGGRMSYTAEIEGRLKEDTDGVMELTEMPYRRNTVTARCRRDPGGAGGSSATSGLQSDVVVRIVDLRSLTESAAATVVDRTSKLFAELDECNIAHTAPPSQSLSPNRAGSPPRRKASEQPDFAALFSTPHMTVVEAPPALARQSNKLIKLSSAFVPLGNSLAFVTDIVKPPPPNTPREAPGQFALRVEKAVAVIIAQLLKALSRAHSRGLFVGNLTASNVFVSKYIRVENDVWPARVRIHDAGVYRCTTVIDDADSMAPDVTPYALWGAPPPSLAREVCPWAAAPPMAAEVAGQHAAAVESAPNIVDVACTDTVVRLLGAPPPPVEAVYLQPSCDPLVSMTDARNDIWALGQLVVELLTDVPVPPLVYTANTPSYEDSVGSVASLGGRVVLFPRAGGPTWSIAARAFVSKACHPTIAYTAEELLEEPFITRNVEKFDESMRVYAARVAERPGPALGDELRLLLPEALDSSVGPSFDHRVPLLRLEEAQDARAAAAATLERQRQDEATTVRQGSLFGVVRDSSATPSTQRSSAGAADAAATAEGREAQKATAAIAATSALVHAAADLREGLDSVTVRLRTGPGTSQLRVPTKDGRRVVFLGDGNANVGQAASGRAAAALDRLSATLMRGDAAMPGFGQALLRSLVSRTMHAAAHGVPQMPPPKAPQPSLPEDNPNVLVKRLAGLLAPMPSGNQGKASGLPLGPGASPNIPPTTPGSIASPNPNQWEDIGADRSRGDYPLLGARRRSAADLAAMNTAGSSVDALGAASSSSAPRATSARAGDMCNFLYAKWLTCAASREADQVLAAAEDDSATSAALVGAAAAAAASSSLFEDGGASHGHASQPYASPMRHNVSMFAMQSSTTSAMQASRTYSMGSVTPSASAVAGGNGAALATGPLYVSHQRAGSLHRANSDSSMLSSP